MLVPGAVTPSESNDTKTSTKKGTRNVHEEPPDPRTSVKATAVPPKKPKAAAVAIKKSSMAETGLKVLQLSKGSSFATLCILSGRLKLQREKFGEYTGRLNGKDKKCFPKSGMHFVVSIEEDLSKGPALLRLEPHGGLRIFTGPYFPDDRNHTTHRSDVLGKLCDEKLHSHDKRECKLNRKAAIEELSKFEYKEVHAQLSNAIYSPALPQEGFEDCQVRCLPEMGLEEHRSGEDSDQGCVKACFVHSPKPEESMENEADKCRCQLYKRLNCYTSPKGLGCTQYKELSNSAFLQQQFPCLSVCKKQLIGF